MIYRLQSGADSEIKKHVLTGFSILVLTIGLPVAGALINRDDLTPSPTNIAQNDSPGVVLGDSTTATSPSSDGSSDTNLARTSNQQQPESMQTATLQSNKPLRVRPAPAQVTGGGGSGNNQTQSSAGVSAEVNIPTPNLPAPSTPAPQPKPSTPTAPVTDDRPILDVNANVLGVEAGVTVDKNDGLGLSLDLGL